MNILDLLWSEEKNQAKREKQLTSEYNEAIEAATKRFMEQKNAIREIADSKGLKEIKRWFETEKEAALNAVMMSSENRDKERARYEVADRFLKFIDNLTIK